MMTHRTNTLLLSDIKMYAMDLRGETVMNNRFSFTWRLVSLAPLKIAFLTRYESVRLGRL